MVKGLRTKILQGTIITDHPGLFKPNEQEQAMYLRSLSKVLPLPPSSIPRDVLDKLRSTKLPLLSSLFDKPKALDSDVQWGVPANYVKPTDMERVIFSSEVISVDHTCSGTGYLQIFVALRVKFEVPPEKFEVRDLKIVVDAQRLNNLLPMGYPSEMDHTGLAFTSAESLKINGFTVSGVASGGNATWIMRNLDPNSKAILPTSFIVFATLSPCVPPKDNSTPVVVVRGSKSPSLGKPFWKTIMSTNSSRSSIQLQQKKQNHNRSQSENSISTTNSSEASASSSVSKKSYSSAERVPLPPSRPISRASQFQVSLNKLDRQAFGGIGPIQLETVSTIIEKSMSSLIKFKSFTAGVRLSQTRYIAIIKPPPDVIGGSCSTFDCFDAALRPQLVWESRDAHEVLRSRITDMITDRDQFLIAQTVDGQLNALEQFLLSLHELQEFYRMHHEDEIQCGYQTSSARLVGAAVKAQMQWFISFFRDKQDQLAQDKRFGAIITAELIATCNNISYYE